MTFQARGQVEEFAALEWTASHLVQSLKDAQANGGAAAEAARAGNSGRDGARKRERLSSVLEKGSGRGTDHSARAFPSPARNRDPIVNLQRHPETIEPRPEIGSARRNADGDLVHDW
jgi:hypothetical protein